MPGPWDLTQAVSDAVAFRDARDWVQFHRPKELAAGIAIEAAELQELFLWRGEEPASDVVANEALALRVQEELADVCVYVLTLAHDLKLDLSACIATKLAENARRYDIDTYRGRADKAPH